MISFSKQDNIIRISTWVIIFGGLILTAIAFTVARTWDRQRIQVEFERAAEDRHAALKREIESNIEVLASVRAFFLHAKVVTRSEFHEFTASLLSLHPSIQALEWIPRVPYSQRPEYEKAARREGFKDFQITERLLQGKMTRAVRREEYFPVYYVEPYKGNEIALGYDLASDPARKQALDRSRDTGEMAATARITLMQEMAAQFGFLVFSPIYKRHSPIDSIPARRGNLWGFALVVFRIHDIVRRSLSYLTSRDIDFYIFDNSARKEDRLLLVHLSGLQKTAASLTDNEYPVPDGSLKTVKTFKVADREWQVLFVATPDYISLGKTWQPWGVLLAGLILTGLLAGFLIVAVRHAEELTKRNELLIQESADRRKTEEALRESEDKFRTIFDRASDGMLIVDAITKKFLQGNTAICSMLGYSKEEIESLTIYDINRPQDISHALDEFDKLAKGERILAEDKPILRKDGSILYADISAFPVIIGGVSCHVGIFRDITVRKRAVSEISAMAKFPSENPQPVLRIARDGTLLYVNESALSQLPDWHLQAGRAAPSMVRDVASQAMTSGKAQLLDLEHRKQVYSFFVAPIANTDYANMYGRDITERKLAEEELRLSEERFRRIFDEGPFGMTLVNSDKTIVMANKAFCGFLGYSEQKLAGQNLMDLTYAEDRETSKELLGKLFAGGTPVFHLEKRYVKKDGAVLWANITASAIYGKEGDVLYCLVMIEDLTERRKAAEKIHLLHYYDSLTGLPNRTFHKELMQRSIEHATRHKEIFAIIYIGLDNFRRINDTLGYRIGDILLKAVADRITSSLRRSDYVARSYEGETTNIVSRVGGDEFIVMAHDINHAQDAAKTTRRLIEEISAPYDLNGRVIFVTASIGIALYPSDGTDVDDLLKNAEMAMRHTKKEGKNDYQFYSGSMNSAVLDLLTLESDLHKALERNELLLYYQPKVDGATRMVNGMEALIRWKHPDKGLITPVQFIPLAETSGLIIPIGEFVIRTVCRQIKAWQEAGCERMNIALNVSARQFDQRNLIEFVKEALKETMIPPKCLELEITESTIMRNAEKAIRTLTELKALGIQIAIDDFGTGYSSLSCLKRLPLDFLKIDMSFVKGLASDPSDQAIVRATIAMAHSLNLKTIAEGVETQEQLSFLQEYGCDEIQGYLFSRPLPAEEIPGILAKGHL